MVTSLTSIIEDNEAVTLREYALRCARSMSQCTMQREEDIGNVSRPGEVTNYYIENVIAASKKLAEIVALSDDEIRQRMLDISRKKKEADQWCRKRHAEKGVKYLRMRDQVVAWDPPPDLVSLKRLMLQQIAGVGPIPWVVPRGCRAVA